MELVFCTICKDRTDELKKLVRTHAPYVDKSLIVLHNRNADNEAFIESQECRDLNVEAIILDVPYHPPTLRNAYLSRLVPGAWALHMDSDEYLEEPALYKLRELIAQAEAENFNRIAFNAHDIRIGLNGGVWDQQSSYFNPVLFKVYEGTCWVGETHGGINTPNVAPRIAQSPYRYFHVKSTASEFLRGCRNYWSTGEVAQNNTSVPEWAEFKSLCSKHGYETFEQFYNALVRGEISDDFKQWFVFNRDSENSEARSWFVVYFGLLHPEQNIYLAGNRDLPYDKSRSPYVGSMTY